MSETEKFSLLKFAGSFFQFLPWAKTLRYAAGIALIGFVGLTIYRAFFMPTESTKQETHIIAQSGAQITVDQKNRKRNQGSISVLSLRVMGLPNQIIGRVWAVRPGCGLSSKETTCNSFDSTAYLRHYE